MNAVISIAVAAIVGICSIFFFKKTDNPVEEAAEVYIEQEMGLEKGSIDLSPETKEEAEKSVRKKPSRKIGNA